MTDHDADADERRERDRRTMEAIARLYRRPGTRRPGTRQPDRMAHYLEVMGRPPLHAEEDRITLRQRPRRR